MYTRLLQKPQKLQQSFFLLGPRGTGKTAWVKSQFPRSLYLDLLETTLYIDLLAHPQHLESLIPKTFQDWIVIDEIQKIPALLNEVHRLIEKYRYRFILTGSSARTLRKKGVNLLAGRALTFFMHPLTTLELNHDFDFKKSLQYGHLPTVFSSLDPKHYLSAYVHTYLQEEVLQEGLTRSLGRFVRFLEIASFSQGALLNVSEIARETGTNRKVVENYFSILDDLLLSFRLPVFSKRAKRDLSTHAKFYFFDVGVFRALRPQGPLDQRSEIEGPALETLFIQEWRALNDYFDLGYQAYYWRTQKGLEIDFVFYGPHGLMAFEIKRSKTLKPSDFKALRLFGADYPEAKLYLLYGGERREYHDSITVLPFVDALRMLPELMGNCNHKGIEVS